MPVPVMGVRVQVPLETPKISHNKIIKMIAICEMIDQCTRIEFIKIISQNLQAAREFEEYAEDQLGTAGFQISFYNVDLSEKEIKAMSEQDIYDFMRDNEDKELYF